MNLLRRIIFNLWYTFRRPPWDSGITPPELWQFIHENPSGRAIDLGCGTGTNAITLARHGWHVTGVDFADVAVERARQKARRENLSITFLVDDVTRLPEVLGPFDLVLDIGCFHALDSTLRPVYLDTIGRVLVPGGSWLLYAMCRSENEATIGLDEAEITAISSRFDLIRREDGFDPGGRQSSWFLFRRH
jgi:cyclopropane fatty-acyl-phospholipid synthase-like methyltransferase